MLYNFHSYIKSLCHCFSIHLAILWYYSINLKGLQEYCL